MEKSNRLAPTPNAGSDSPPYRSRDRADSGTDRGAQIARPAGRRYLDIVGKLISRLGEAEWPSIVEAARQVADCIDDGRHVHVFGSGHSHMLAEEMYYRAGGLVNISPILFDGLMLHQSTARSTALERLPGLAETLIADHPIAAGDVVILVSNSGGNVVTVEMARIAHDHGAVVIAITSMNHATSPQARGTDGPRLHMIADITIDNGGAIGDAAIDIDGFDRAVAPTSTVIGAAIINAIVAQCVEELVRRRRPPDVYQSLNTAVGDADHRRRASRASAAEGRS